MTNVTVLPSVDAQMFWSDCPTLTMMAAIICVVSFCCYSTTVGLDEPNLASLIHCLITAPCKSLYRTYNDHPSLREDGTLASDSLLLPSIKVLSYPKYSEHLTTAWPQLILQCDLLDREKLLSDLRTTSLYRLRRQGKSPNFDQVRKESQNWVSWSASILKFTRLPLTQAAPRAMWGTSYGQPGLQDSGPAYLPQTAGLPVGKGWKR